MTCPALHQFLSASAECAPEQTAIVEPEHGSISYAALERLSDQVRDHLHDLGVVRGDRVGLYMRKSIDAVATIFGILKTGAAYVPVDAGAPVARNAYILHDCAVKVVAAEDRFAAGLRTQTVALGRSPRFLLLKEVGGGRALREALDGDRHPGAAQTVAPGGDDLAYVLYTSGSTGRPKGVMLSHANAISFVDWCSAMFDPRAGDRFSSHAPLHFDLSILDLYVSIKHGATLVLVNDDVARDALRLAALMAEERITIWYSAPSILSLLAQYGRLERHDYRALRMVLFAGEVFPVKHLRRLHELLPTPRYFNLYGPTETNVCTYYELPARIPAERTAPFPIGKVCAHLQARVVNEHGHDVSTGSEGELYVAGASVMRGYWNLPDENARAVHVDASGRRWYKTGDTVVEDVEGNCVFVGRRDRMVKRRGYRVELGEIEAGLYRHPAVKEAAVVAVADEQAGVRIKAFLSCRDNERPTFIELKRFCAEHLPLYMVPDTFAFREALPKTSTDKVDYQQLKEIA